jgi:hypothetical protein
MMARADHGPGRAEEARHLLTTALGQAALGSQDAVALRLDVVENHLMMGRWAQALDTAAAARTQAQALGDPTLRPQNLPGAPATTEAPLPRHRN